MRSTCFSRGSTERCQQFCIGVDIATLLLLLLLAMLLLLVPLQLLLAMLVLMLMLLLVVLALLGIHEGCQQLRIVSRGCTAFLPLRNLPCREAAAQRCLVPAEMVQ